MPTQAEREAKFIWRPNDNSSTTLTRYDQEAEHWVKAFKNAAPTNTAADLGSIFSIIGLLITLTLNLIYIIVLSVVQFVKWLRSFSN